MSEEKRQSATQVLVLGGAGFIGAAVVRHLRGQGYRVQVLGRDPAAVLRSEPDVGFVARDLRRMTQTRTWEPVLENVDLVVNCAGALQDSSGDDLAAVHLHAVAALAEAAAERSIHLIQISTVGADPKATTEFMRSKGQGDAALRESGARVWILRPGLVLGQGAYGGTALLRMLAAVPLVQPIAMAQSQIQSVSLDDVVRVVGQAASEELPSGTYDLVEDTPHSLAEVLSRTRSWLGFAPATTEVNLPRWMARIVGLGADQLGRLGWRSPLRTTALQVLEGGVTGDPGLYRRIMGQGMAPLSQIFAGFTSGVENRLAARMALMMPLAVAVLSLFWIVSGALGLAQFGVAGAHLTSEGWPAWLAVLSVIFWSLVDIAVGFAVLWRPWAARACEAILAVSAVYLLAAVIFTPHLWADPLGPIVKIIPGMMLALITRQLLETR